MGEVQPAADEGDQPFVMEDAYAATVRARFLVIFGSSADPLADKTTTSEWKDPVQTPEQQGSQGILEGSSAYATASKGKGLRWVGSTQSSCGRKINVSKQVAKAASKPYDRPTARPGNSMCPPPPVLSSPWFLSPLTNPYMSLPHSSLMHVNMDYLGMANHGTSSTSANLYAFEPASLLSTPSSQNLYGQWMPVSDSNPSDFPGMNATAAALACILIEMEADDPLVMTYGVTAEQQNAGASLEKIVYDKLDSQFWNEFLDEGK